MILAEHLLNELRQRLLYNKNFAVKHLQIILSGKNCNRLQFSCQLIPKIPIIMNGMCQFLLLETRLIENVFYSMLVITCNRFHKCDHKRVGTYAKY